LLCFLSVLSHVELTADVDLGRSSSKIDIHACTFAPSSGNEKVIQLFLLLALHLHAKSPFLGTSLLFRKSFVYDVLAKQLAVLCDVYDLVLTRIDFTTLLTELLFVTLEGFKFNFKNNLLMDSLVITFIYHMPIFACKNFEY